MTPNEYEKLMHQNETHDHTVEDFSIPFFRSDLFDSLVTLGFKITSRNSAGLPEVFESEKKFGLLVIGFHSSSISIDYSIYRITLTEDEASASVWREHTKIATLENFYHSDLIPLHHHIYFVAKCHCATDGYFLHGNLLKEIRGSDTMQCEHQQIGKLKILQSWAEECDVPLPTSLQEVKQIPSLLLCEESGDSDSNITYIPNELHLLESVTKFHANLIKLEEARIPDGIWGLKSLTELILYYSHAKIVDSQISNLRRLELLCIEYSSINSIASEISELQNIRVLFLRYNQLDSIPFGIYELGSLEQLYLDENKIFQIASLISKLLKLKILSLSKNSLGKLPAELCFLENLEELHLESNRLTCLPKGLHKLTSLRLLYLQGNRFGNFPEDLVNIPNLEVFQLHNNQIREIPKSIIKLISVWHICLMDNKLLKIPMELFELPKLKSLDLSYNLIAELPEEAAYQRSASLEEIRINGNLLKSLPEKFGQLKNLRTIDASNNLIESFTCSLANCTKLFSVNLADNKLRVFPEALLSAEGICFSIDLSGNQISELPPAINKLNRLRVLDLSRNNLTQIPIDFEEMNSLEELELRGNPIHKDERRRLDEISGYCKISYD
jgi:Leucine-rich repeat (LRR) protein